MNPIVSHPVMVFLVLLACCVSLAPFVNAETCPETIARYSCSLNEELSDSSVTIDCTDWSHPLLKSQSITIYLWAFYYVREDIPYRMEFLTKNARYEYPGGDLSILHIVHNNCGEANGTWKPHTFYCNNPSPGFTVDKESGTAPLTVHITDTSQHTPAEVTTWEYRKDNVPFSTQRNPTLTFSSPGTYTITQIVKKSCNPDAMSVSRTIKVKTASPDVIVSRDVNLSAGTTPTTTVTTTVTPTVTTTTVSPAPVVPVYVDTTARGSVPMTTAPITAQVTSTTQQAATAGASPAPSQAPGTPAPASPGTGTLSVATKPEGAQIYIDDVLRGMSPASIPELPSGQHMLRLEKAGYKNMTVPVSIGEAKVTEYSTSLEAESGGLGIVPVIAGVLVIAALGGGAYLYTRKKGPGTPEQK